MSNAKEYDRRLKAAVSVLRAENKRLRAALAEIIDAAEADYGVPDDYEDTEAVAATQEQHGPIKESTTTFGMIRRGRAALSHPKT